MEVRSGDVLQVMLPDTLVYWRISAIDRRVVKLFDEEGRYRQMPYENLMAMIGRGYIQVVVPT
jgi:hypothetical protein